MCRKGENIRKRKDGRWEARYIKYRDPEGKIHYGSLYGKTYGEVKDKRNKKIAEVPGYGHLVRNLGILNYQATFETVAEHWKQEIRIQRTVIRIKNLDQTANPDTGKSPQNHSVYRSAEDRTFQQGNSIARQAAVLCETFSQRWLRIYFVWNYQMHGASGNPAQICSTAENMWNFPY